MKSVIIICILIILLATGCATSAPPAAQTTAAPKLHGTFIEGESGGDAETLNWLLAADASSFSYVGHTLDSLATYDNDWEVVLRHLAKPVEISADGLTYTMTIRDDLKWSDGVKVTAEDYVYTLHNLMFSDWLNYPYKSDWQETVNGESVFTEAKAVNETTFTIKRQTIDPEFIDNSIYSLTPYPRHIAAKYEGDIKAFTQAEEFNNLSYTGNLGPYKYKEWVRTDKLVVDRNPDYYLAKSGKDAGSPFFLQYIVKLFGTSSAVLAALEAGDVTSAGIEPEQVAKFKSMPQIKVYTSPTRSYDLMVLNLRNNGWEGLKNQAVRQALAMSIDKQAVINSIRQGFGDPAFSFIPKPSPWYSDDGVAQFGYGAQYDKVKARQLLGGAGYEVKTVNSKSVLQDKAGNPVKLVLATTPGSTISENMAFLAKQELADIGIEVEIKLVPWPTLLRQYVMNKEPGKDQEARYNNGPAAVSEQSWDMIIMAFSTHPIAPSGSRVFFTSDGGLNFGGYRSTKIDELFARVSGKEAIDSKVRKSLYTDISRTIADEQPAIFLTFPQGNSGFQSNVEGIEPGMRMSWNYHMWYFAQP
ncbi:MAG: ABC transporter substrate-binding protein [Dehalococcoidales bacterium]|nr:ABC transporter substrate-binding protein [Dehalococcoidales bacterium]